MSKISWLTALVPIVVQFVIFLRWLHRRMRNDEITRAFVRDIAANHLPHIYNALQKIAMQQGIDLDDTPFGPIRRPQLPPQALTTFSGSQQSSQKWPRRR